MWKKGMAGMLLLLGLWAGDAAASDMPITQTNQQTIETKEVKSVLRFDKAAVKQIMIEYNHFSDEEAEGTCKVLQDVDVRFQPILDAYSKDRTISDAVNVEGLTVKMLMYKQNCNFWDGLTGLDFCLNHPGLAKETLERFPFVEGQ